MSLNLQEVFHEVIDGRPKGGGQKMLAIFLKIVSIGYAAVVRTIRAAHLSGIFPRHRLPCPVISVGNLTWGGTGKTPTVIFLARYLKGLGLRPAVLTRGYGRDEVDLLRRLLPEVPVCVGRDRVRTGKEAIKQGAQVLILDDGFQHWRLHRDLDIVLLNAENPFGNGWMLPGGILREEPRALGRAGVVILNKINFTERDAEAFRARVQNINSRAVVVSARYHPEGFEIWPGSPLQPMERWQGVRAGIFSGIADPASFERMLEQERLVAVMKKRWIDHHPYREEELKQLAVECQRAGASAMVTTLKDAVRIPEAWVKGWPIPLAVLHVNLQLLEEANFFDRLRSVLDR